MTVRGDREQLKLALNDESALSSFIDLHSPPLLLHPRTQMPSSFFRILLPAALVAASMFAQAITPSPVVSPSPTASAFPSLTVEHWGVYDTSSTSSDPNEMLPVSLLRSNLDNELFLPFANFVDPASNPPQSAWRAWSCRSRAHCVCRWSHAHERDCGAARGM